MALEALGIWKTNVLLSRLVQETFMDLIRSFATFWMNLVAQDQLKPRPCGSKAERKDANIDNHERSVKEFQLYDKEIVSNDLPLETLGFVLHSLVCLWWRNLSQILVYRLSVRDQLRACRRHGSNFQMTSGHSLQ